MRNRARTFSPEATDGVRCANVLHDVPHSCSGRSPLLKALLLDLDGTLLDLDGDAFLESYIDAVAAWLSPVVDAERFSQAVWVGSIPMMTRPHPRRSNRRVLWEGVGEYLGLPSATLEKHLGERLGEEDLAAIYPGGQPVAGARDLLLLGQRLKLKLALATMPIYPEAVVRERLRRANLADIRWDFIATEDMDAVKPEAAYWEAIMAALNVEPAECLVVGDDYFRDIRQVPTGMHTFYVGPYHPGLDPGPSGTLTDLSRQLACARS